MHLQCNHPQPADEPDGRGGALVPSSCNGSDLSAPLIQVNDTRPRHRYRHRGKGFRSTEPNRRTGGPDPKGVPAGAGISGPYGAALSRRRWSRQRGRFFLEKLKRPRHNRENRLLFSIASMPTAGTMDTELLTAPRRPTGSNGVRSSFQNKTVDRETEPLP